jgi:thymidylate synthase
MQRIVVFQQRGSGEDKIRGIREHGRELTIQAVVSIDQDLPVVIDDPEKYLPATIQADLVLDHLRHPDLSQALAVQCRDQGIPVVASGKHIPVEGLVAPPTCCGLGRRTDLGAYAEQFGSPELKVEMDQGRITRIEVVRGAPCGATWDACARVIGKTPQEAVTRYGLEAQLFCKADPSNWDPVHGKSPVHFAGHVHARALDKASD